VVAVVVLDLVLVCGPRPVVLSWCWRDEVRDEEPGDEARERPMDYDSDSTNKYSK